MSQNPVGGKMFFGGVAAFGFLVTGAATAKLLGIPVPITDNGPELLAFSALAGLGIGLFFGTMYKRF